VLIKGGFGSGKSHALSFLAHTAAQQGFVVSRISINKETPLSNPDKLFCALAESAELPDRSGAGLFEAGHALSVESDGFKALELWSRSEQDLDTRLSATLQLYRLGRRNYEMRDQILRFWSGDPLGVSFVKSCMKSMGMPCHGPLRTVPSRQLGFQRPRFASRLLRAAGYSGWVWLIDEVETIASYSLLQRMRSYSQIGIMLGESSSLDCPGVVPVVAITDDFESYVLRDKRDAVFMPEYFRQRCQIGVEDPKSPPQAGILAIKSSGILLEALGDSDVEELYFKIREMYRVAYNWDPPKNDFRTSASSTTIRQRIKYWVTAWDIQRLVGPAEFQIEAQPIEYKYIESLPDETERSNDESMIEEIMRGLG
jgi:hypothetical protein